MTRKKSLILAVLAVVVLATVSADGDSDPPQVTIGSGKIEGHWRKSRNGRTFAAFEGVPYARPPINDLRFKPPQPAEPWTEVLSAKKLSAVCPQGAPSKSENHQIRVFGQENCLYANIYSPNINDTESLDVMVFIHGGAFIMGTGGFYKPDYLLDKDIVYVSFNYRLGALGFLSTGDDQIQGNNGFKDMVLLLKWVQENISKFGGNPNSVTIFGESAGGGSVSLLLLSPLAKGLFHKAIAQSGSALAPWAVAYPERAKKNAAILARAIGCPENPSKEFVDCLRTKSAQDFINTYFAFYNGQVAPLIPFKGVVEASHDGAFLTKHPRDIYTTSGPVSDVPFIAGVTSHEGGLVAIPLFTNRTALEEFQNHFELLGPLNMFMEDYPKDLLDEEFGKARKFYFGTDPIKADDVFKGIDFFSDGAMIWPTLETIKLHRAKANSEIYFYEYSHVSNRSFSYFYGGQSTNYGASHGDDLVALFPISERHPNTTADDATSKTLIEFFTTFAKHGKPTTDNTWKSVLNGSAAEYMHIGSPGDVKMMANYIPERNNFWSGLQSRLNYGAPPTK